MKIKDITPKAMRCIIGGCPAIYETNRDTFVVIGRRLDSRSVTNLLDGKLTSEEEAIEIPRNLLINNKLL